MPAGSDPTGAAAPANAAAGGGAGAQSTAGVDEKPPSGWDEAEWEHSLTRINEADSEPAGDDAPTGGEADGGNRGGDPSPLPSVESVVAKVPRETRAALEEILRGRISHVSRIDPGELK